MNPELPPNPRAEMEARLTAYLLGELPPHEAAAVRSALDDDAELAQLCERLKPVIKLVRATAATPAQPMPAPSAPLKLSEERRQKLLAHFKTIKPVEFTRPPERKTSLLVPLAAAAVITLLLAGLLLPSLAKAKYKARSFAILNNLRQLDGAKQMWAAENKKSAADVPTFSDIEPYMGRGGGSGVPQTIAGENYVLGPVGELPSAELDAAKARELFASRVPAAPATGPEGKRVRMSLDGGVQFSEQNPAEREFAKVDQHHIALANGTLTFNASNAATDKGPRMRIVLPSDDQAVDIAQPVTNNWSFPTGSPNIGSLGRVPQSSTGSKPELEAKSITNSGTLWASDPEWVGTLGPANSAKTTSNAFVGRYGFDIAGQTTTNSITVAPRNSFDLAWNDGISKDAGQRQLVAIPEPNLAPEIDPATGLPMAKAGTGDVQLEFRTSSPGEETVHRRVETIAKDFTVDNATLGSNFGGVGGAGGGGGISGYVAGTTKADKEGLNKGVSQLFAEDRFDLRGNRANDKSISEKEKIPIQYANPSSLPTNLAGNLAINGSTEPALGTNPSSPQSAHVVSLQNANPVDVAEVLNEVISTNKALNGKGEIARIPADKTPLLGDLPVNGRLVSRGFSLLGPTSDAFGPAPAQRAPEGGVAIADGLTSPVATTENGRLSLSGDTDASGKWKLETGNANASTNVTLTGLVTLPSGRGSKLVFAKPADAKQIDRFYADVNRNGGLDQGVSQGGKTNSNDAHSVESVEAVGYVSVTVTTNAVKTVQGGSAVIGAGQITLANTAPSLQPPARAGGLAPVKQAERESNIDDAAVKKPATPAPIPQPEVLTSENHFSTFSLNVSDVSFKLAAASLEKGVLPEPASIRSEEFINAFNYRDPDPAPGAPIGFAWERAHDPFEQNRDLVRFSVKTAAAGREPGRPLNIVLLLDNSGSMERADRVQIIHEALRVLATQLQPQDKLSIVTFARTARLWVDGIAGNEAGTVAEQVGNLTPQGGTNLEEAMRLAYETARRHYLPTGVNRVVLLTDGAANLGNVEPGALKQKVEENRKQGIALDCFGIGWEGYNDDLLEVLARNGDGRYGFLNTPEEAATDFAGQLAGALRVAASDVKVQVEFNPKRVTAYRQIGYAKHQLTKEQFRDNTVNAAQIGAAESGNALYTIAVNPAGEGPLGTVRVRFRKPGTSDYQEHAWELPYNSDCSSLGQASAAMRLAATASAFSESLATSPFAAEVTSDRLLGYLRGVPEIYGADTRPRKLEWMIRQVKSLTGK